MLKSIKQSDLSKQLHRVLAAVCALFMLVFVPLVFRNALFDINRVKVDVILIAAPVFCLVCVLFFAVQRRSPILGKEARRICFPLICFALSAVVSSARHGFDQPVLLGTNGRLCGLLFLLACICAFFVIVFGSLKGSVIAASACVAASIVAALGVLNSVGIDPLGFYARMQRGQWHLFLSTIGNIDFFGCYLALMLPISAGGYVHAGRKREAVFYLIASLCITTGIAASRADTAILAVQIGMLVLLVQSGNSYRKISKVLFLWALSFAALVVIYRLLLNVTFHLPISGLFLVLCKQPAALVAFAVLMICALCSFAADKKGKKAPGVKLLSKASVVAVILLAAILLVLMVYFSVCAPDTEIGGLSPFLRFNDQWGTRRGFVYRCAFRALCEFSPADILFGQGVDCAQDILEPYFDNPDMLVHGVFNDAHSQPLQYLLTTGVAGAGSLIVFHFLLLSSLCRRSVKEPRLAGFCAALFAYIPIALTSVSQPILIAVYLSVSALAVSMLQYAISKEGNL